MSIITHRNNTKRVKVGELYIGGANEVIIQSMTTTKTHDIEATVEQINRLAKAGCQLVRVACLDETDAKALKEIKQQRDQIKKALINCMETKRKTKGENFVLEKKTF